MLAINKICLLGYGEVGRKLSADLLRLFPQSDLSIQAWDVAFSHTDKKTLAALKGEGVAPLQSIDQLARDCQLIISAVTAGQAIAAADSVLPFMTSGAHFLDLNSVSPESKQVMSARVTAVGGRFVEGSILSPIDPKGIASPILLGGSEALEFLPEAKRLGFSGAAFSSEHIGRAAATKMCRSVMIKGMEALLTEALLAARHYGVEQEVLTSLNNIMPMPDWSQTARYMIARSIEHGVRRAEEMREVVITVEQAGIDAWMSSGCVERQQWASGFTSELVHLESAPSDGLIAMLDGILRHGFKIQGFERPDFEGQSATRNKIEKDPK